MSNNCQHRKRCKRYNIPGDAHHLTFSCYNRLPLLASDRTREWLGEAVERACAGQNIALWAYVFMPEHVHLLVRPREASYDISRFLFAVKRPVAGRARMFLERWNQTEWLSRLTAEEGSRQVFRFWKPGGGFDKNIRERTAVAGLAGYIHANPVRRGLVDAPTEWQWSSAAWWISGETGPVEMSRVSWEA